MLELDATLMKWGLKVISEAGANCNLENEAAEESLGELLPIKALSIILNCQIFCANANS
jgi:hypothetical protein